MYCDLGVGEYEERHIGIMVTVVWCSPAPMSKPSIYQLFSNRLMAIDSSILWGRCTPVSVLA